MLKGTKFGALDCVTKPKPVSATGFPTLQEANFSLFKAKSTRKLAYAAADWTWLEIQSTPSFTVFS